MRGRSSSKQGSKGGMEIDKVDNKLKDQEPHLSGAYIRSLVKQLTSSRNKDPMNPKDPDGEDGDGHPNLAKFGGGFSDQTQQSQPPPQQPQQQHKKQVRRRLHTSRPYQERLLNMAEARREIVTALKFHRAAMKQANEQQQSQPQSQPQSLQPSPPKLSLEQEGKLKSRRNPRIYASITPSFSNYIDNFSSSSYSSFSCPPNPYSSWPSSPIAPPPPPPIPENLNLPNQTLGLNLNLHDFNNLDTTLYHNSSNNPSIYSSSLSPSTTYSSPTLSVATEEVPSVVISHEGPPFVSDVADAGYVDGGGLGLHPAMGDEEMAEIRSIGEQHQVEWNDTLNLVTSAWWFKFLKTMEIGPEEKAEDDEGLYHPFDQVMEFPAWLNAANESCLQQQLNDHCSNDYLQDPALTCMDIGEIEGMDGEWLT